MPGRQARFLKFHTRTVKVSTVSGTTGSWWSCWLLLLLLLLLTGAVWPDSNAGSRERERECCRGRERERGKLFYDGFIARSRVRYRTSQREPWRDMKWISIFTALWCVCVLQKQLIGVYVCECVECFVFPLPVGEGHYMNWNSEKNWEKVWVILLELYFSVELFIHFCYSTIKYFQHTLLWALLNSTDLPKKAPPPWSAAASEKWQELECFNPRCVPFFAKSLPPYAGCCWCAKCNRVYAKRDLRD